MDPRPVPRFVAIGYDMPMSTPCCQRMGEDLAHTCDIHPDRHDCPDALVARIGHGYGLIVHDGGSSSIEIAFCPWCGTRLPSVDGPEAGDATA